MPANWNGKLVMYAHGYPGTGAALGVSNPSIRRCLVQNGDAWAASSYSKNYYDVRAGVEDTNALALEFTRIATANTRTLAAPSKIYITGHSMGGHITAAAIEDEAAATAVNKVKYHGAVPMCGVVGDTALFDQFAAIQVTAQALAGAPSYPNPTAKWSEISALVTSSLFTTFPSVPNATGANVVSVLQNITGGPQPLYSQGLAFGGSFPSAWGALAADTNRLRTDGIRWIPKANGEFRIPVASIHTLGDLFVPFSMQYAKRVAAKGNSGWLVQRAICGASHCDFTVAEQATAFDDMNKWERDGIKPAGDHVLTPAVVAAATYGCTHTKNTLGPDESGATRALRHSQTQTAESSRRHAHEVASRRADRQRANSINRLLPPTGATTDRE